MESMKIYITEYTHKGKTEEGPILYAHSMSEAQEVAACRFHAVAVLQHVHKFC